MPTTTMAISGVWCGIALLRAVGSGRPRRGVSIRGARRLDQSRPRDAAAPAAGRVRTRLRRTRAKPGRLERGRKVGNDPGAGYPARVVRSPDAGPTFGRPPHFPLATGTEATTAHYSHAGGRNTPTDADPCPL